MSSLRRDAGDDLGLVVLAHVLEELHGLVARHHAPADLQVRRGDFLHLRFELLEVFGREGTLEREVVVEAVLDDRADGDLRLRVDGLHRLGQQVRGGVADDLERRRILLRDDGQLRVFVDDEGRVDQLAVHAAGERRLGQSRADAGGDFRDA